MVARLQPYLGFLLFEMYSVVFVTALYSGTAMSLTLVKEYIYIYIYIYIYTDIKMSNRFISGD